MSLKTQQRAWNEVELLSMSSKWQPVERATGISKQQWLEFFEPHKDKDHKELAQLALQYVAEKAPECNQGWWAQYATINYEEILGRRKPGQRSDGKYGASASKTLPGGRKEIVVAWAAWAEENLGLGRHGDVVGEVALLACQAGRCPTERQLIQQGCGEDGAGVGGAED